jgi:hypothetical protein
MFNKAQLAKTVTKALMFVGRVYVYLLGNFNSNKYFNS